MTWYIKHSDDELCHYGVKGQKWGVINDTVNTAKHTYNTIKKAASEIPKDLEEYKKAEDLYSRIMKTAKEIDGGITQVTGDLALLEHDIRKKMQQNDFTEAQINNVIAKAAEAYKKQGRGLYDWNVGAALSDLLTPKQLALLKRYGRIEIIRK